MSSAEHQAFQDAMNQRDALRARIAELEAQAIELTASLEAASATCIMLKQQQREGWAKIASGQLTRIQKLAEAGFTKRQSARTANGTYPEEIAQLASGQEPAAWQTFDGEGGYDFRQFAENETYRDDYIKQNGEKYAAWVEPLYTHPEPAQQPLSDEQAKAIAGEIFPMAQLDRAAEFHRRLLGIYGIKEKP